MLFRYAIVTVLLVCDAGFVAVPTNAGLPVRASRPVSATRSARTAKQLFKRAEALNRAEQFDAAISDFTKGRAFGAEFAAAYVGRAKAHRAAGRKKEAEEDLRRAEFLNPSLSK